MNKDYINKNITNSTFNSRKSRRVFIVDNTSCHEVETNQIIKNKEYGLSLRCSAQEDLQGNNAHNCNKGNTSQEYQFKKNGSNSSFAVDVGDYGSNLTEKNLTFKAVVAMFFKRSSIYALNQIANSKSTGRKLLWGIIMIGGLFGCSSQILRYLAAYAKYPVVVNINSISEFSLTFPAITICNFNAIRKPFVSCFIEQLSYELCNETMSSNKSEVEFMSRIKQPSCIENINKKLSPVILKRVQFLTIYSKLNAATRHHYGHQKPAFIRSCSFRGEVCSHANFTLYQDSIYGNCYTFNKANESKPPLKTSDIGPDYGLNLELNLEISEYIWMTERVGARIVIHDPFNEPDPHEDGLNVSPGFETSVAISKVSFRRLPHPYKDQCIHYQPGNNQRKCEIDCVKKITYSTCSCAIPFYDNADNIRYCDFDNDTEVCCMYIKKTKAEYDCQCSLACENSHYEMQISSAVWPLDVYRNVRYKENKTGSANGLLQESVSEEKLRKTRLKVNIYYDTLEHLIYQQKPMFEDSEVLSQIGGPIV
ncbi:acid-sensing ion channel 2-like [Stegodyphus dumicola]|uniref:acid-sensing ion channel 2-like n=1 Tax=Stegodyphus dumicola TaxID=202533 RepID=UPI0015AF5622|nr:acid-sensing ion channel 2-like [Stegodyphus dumicola]